MGPTHADVIIFLMWLLRGLGEHLVDLGLESLKLARWRWTLLGKDCGAPMVLAVAANTADDESLGRGGPLDANALLTDVGLGEVVVNVADSHLHFLKIAFIK